MIPDITAHLQRWRDAGLLDEATAARILAFESAQAEAPPARLRWPAIVALVFGALMVGAGLLLFVAAHWDKLGPSARFSLVLGTVALFHGLGAWFAERLPKLAVALHGLGTLALGAGIFMSGQIFNLQEHWPAGVMAWALGAAIGWLLLRDWVQGALLSLLAPAWLTSEWIAFVEARRFHEAEAARVIFCALLMLAVTYLTARRDAQDSLARKALGWLGGLAFLPLAIGTLAFSAHDRLRLVGRGELHWTHLLLVLALGALLSLGLAFLLRRKAAVWNLVAAGWVLPLGLIGFSEWTIYAWSALGAAGLVAWGLHESRRERVNLGLAGFAITLFVFYFSSVMDKLGRSLGLMGLGLLFLLGGWQLERLRRRLNARITGGAR